MKTQKLIELLATGAGPAPLTVVPRRVGMALLAGAMASAVVCLAILGPNPRLAGMGPALAVKLLYALGVVGASAWWLARLSRPAANWHRAAAALLLVLGLMGTWAASATVDTPAESRLQFLLGSSWAVCPWRVAMLALPAWAMALWALRGLAPTRLRLTGFAAGLFGGGAGALAYALSCPETSPAFVLVWYSLGMLLPACIGTWLGPRLLRW